MSQESGDTYYQGTQFRIVKDDKGKASDIEWAEDAYYQSEEFKKIEAAQEAEDRADNKKKYGTCHVPRHLRYIDPDSDWEVALEIRGMQVMPDEP